LQGFRSGYQDVWGAFGLAGAFFGFGVAVPYSQFYVQVVAPPLEPFKQISVECPKRRYIEHFNARGFWQLKKHA
jgi:hypothetical protein